MRVLLFFTLTFSLFSCGRDEEQTTNRVLQGTAYYKIRFSTDSTKLIPLALTDIYIRKPSDPDQAYFDKIKTDPEGQFYYQNATRPLTLFVKTSYPLDTGNTIQLYDTLQVSATAANNLVLIATFDESDQNALLLYLRDEEGGAIPDATVHLYTSAALAGLNNASASVATLHSGNNGFLYKAGLPAGRYFINATKTVDSANVYQRIAKEINIAAAGIVQDTVLLKKKTPVFKNGFTFFLKDTVGGIFPKATAYLFNSAVLAATNNPDAALETLISDDEGKLIKNDLPAGVYYLNVQKTVDTLQFQRLVKPFTLLASGMVQDTIVLRLVAPATINRLTITVSDSLGGTIPQATVLLYTSRVLASSNDPAGAIESFTTDLAGKVTKVDLPAGRYYLNGRKTADTLTYERLLKTIDMPDRGEVIDSLVLRKKQ